jgi:hypothetical protein
MYKVLATIIKKGLSKSLVEDPSNDYVEKEKQLKVEYTPEELQFIITTLGEQTFKIKEIEFIYNLIVKLQHDYLQQKNKK